MIFEVKTLSFLSQKVSRRGLYDMEPFVSLGCRSSFSIFCATPVPGGPYDIERRFPTCSDGLKEPGVELPSG